MRATYALDMNRLPEHLYHGTDCSNIPSVCKKGERLNVKEERKTCALRED